MSSSSTRSSQHGLDRPSGWGRRGSSHGCSRLSVTRAPGRRSHRIASACDHHHDDRRAVGRRRDVRRRGGGDRPRPAVRDVPLSGAVTGVVLPFLREVGDRWEAGTLSVAHEHFVTDMLRRTLSALSSVPPHRCCEDASAPSPVVLLACPPGERHDLVLLCVALMLRERGVRARFLGADTPIPAILAASRVAGADAVVLAATRPTAFTAHALVAASSCAGLRALRRGARRGRPGRRGDRRGRAARRPGARRGLPRRRAHQAHRPMVNLTQIP